MTNRWAKSTKTKCLKIRPTSPKDDRPKCPFSSETGERTSDSSRTWNEEDVEGEDQGVELEEFCHKNRFSSGGRWPEEGWYRERERERGNSRGYRCWWYCTVADIKMPVIDVCTVLSGTALRYTPWQWGGQWEISPYAPY